MKETGRQTKRSFLFPSETKKGFFFSLVGRIFCFFSLKDEKKTVLLGSLVRRRDSETSHL